MYNMLTNAAGSRSHFLLWSNQHHWCWCRECPRYMPQTSANNCQLARYIVADIGGSDKSVWLSQVSAITVTLLGPAIAQATDLWGRKWFVVSTTLLGFAGSLVVSRVTTINVAIAGEILAALGYSSQGLLNAIASEILPRRYRPAAQGGLGLTSGLEAAFSLLLGFYLCGSSTGGWRLF